LDDRAGGRRAVHLPARLSLQRASRRGGGAIGRAGAPREHPRARARATRAQRDEGPRPSRATTGAARRRRRVRPAGWQGGGADGGLPFGLSSHARLEWSPPLRGDGFLTMPGIYIETYGCQMNVSDSELMLGVLGREGYVRTDDPAQADVVLVNTCAVRDHAEQKVLSRMGELKRLKRPGSVLGVVGCKIGRASCRERVEMGGGA